uniref:Solute carrier family 23 member 1 n=1 Tax=Equus caballus TaxID=9796 RepID=F6QB34_HORSE
MTSCEHPDFLQKDDNMLSSQDDGRSKKKDGQSESPSSSHLAYGILDVPPWYLCILLGIQHFLTALGGLVAVPLILAKDLCLQHDSLTQSYLISTMFFVSGICTLLQVLLGVRLPILQGGTFAFVAPSLAMLSLPAWKCPEWTLNASQVNTSSPEFTEEWQKRIRELQGVIMVASCVQILVGFSGLIGFLMRFIGPLTIAPTISLMALPLFHSAGNDAGTHWGIAAVTIFLIVLFSQYLKNVAVPMPIYGREKKLHTSKFYLFQVFPVGSRMVIVAAGCVLLVMGVFGKIGAAFATIPTPVIGGMFLVMFGIIAAVGISNLQYVDMNSSRNIFVFGFSIFCGLAVPNWVNKNPEMLHTGILQLDQVFLVLLTTDMFVGGFLGFLLDNTIPGSPEERGLLTWSQIHEESEQTMKASEIYSLPCGIGTKFCTSSYTWYLPFWPRPEHHGKGFKTIASTPV